MVNVKKFFWDVCNAFLKNWQVWYYHQVLKFLPCNGVVASKWLQRTVTLSNKPNNSKTVGEEIDVVNQWEGDGISCVDYRMELTSGFPRTPEGESKIIGEAVGET